MAPVQAVRPKFQSDRTSLGGAQKDKLSTLRSVSRSSAMPGGSSARAVIIARGGRSGRQHFWRSMQKYKKSVEIYKLNL